MLTRYTLISLNANVTLWRIASDARESYPMGEVLSARSLFCFARGVGVATSARVEACRMMELAVVAPFAVATLAGWCAVGFLLSRLIRDSIWSPGWILVLLRSCGTLCPGDSSRGCRHQGHLCAARGWLP